MNTMLLGAGRISLQFRWLPMGDGVCLAITGGRAHIGAATICVGAEESATVCRKGHREDMLSELVSRTLSQAGVPCCVVCGVHYDNITKEEIAAVLRLGVKGAQELAKKWKEWMLENQKECV